MSGLRRVDLCGANGTEKKKKKKGQGILCTKSQYIIMSFAEQHHQSVQSTKKKQSSVWHELKHNNVYVQIVNKKTKNKKKDIWKRADEAAVFDTRPPSTTPPQRSRYRRDNLWCSVTHPKRASNVQLIFGSLFKTPPVLVLSIRIHGIKKKVEASPITPQTKLCKNGCSILIFFFTVVVWGWEVEWNPRLRLTNLQ